MPMTLGLSGNKPYILNHVVFPSNMEATEFIPVKQIDKEYRDDDVVLTLKLPFFTEPLSTNEEYTKKVIDTIKAESITSIKNVINNMILSLDYILTDYMGNSVSSEIKISDIQLENLIFLSTGKVGDVLSYRHIKKIVSRVVIDIKRDRNYGITYHQTQPKAEPYNLVIQGLNVFAQMVKGDNTFDDITDRLYREKVFNYISTTYNSNEAIYKQFVNKYFSPESAVVISEDYNRFWSCKDDYKYKTQYLLDKEILGQNGIDIISNDMLKAISPTPISFEIKKVNKITIDLELFVETGEVTDIATLENPIIDNRAIIDGIVFTQPPSDTSETTDTTTPTDPPIANDTSSSTNTDTTTDTSGTTTTETTDGSTTTLPDVPLNP